MKIQRTDYSDITENSMIICRKDIKYRFQNRVMAKGNFSTPVLQFTEEKNKIQHERLNTYGLNGQEKNSC